MANRYIDINIIAKLKGYTTNRPIRQEINKPNSKYTARKVKKQGGFSYEILFSTLEQDIQDKILDEEMKSRALVPINNNNNTVYEFRTEKLKLVALAKIDVIKAFEKFSLRYEKKKQAEELFLDLYNSGEYLKDVYKLLGKISKSSLYRWNRTYKKYGTVESLIPNYKCSKQHTIKECIKALQKQDIDINKLDYLMMSTKTRVINRHEITFLGLHYRSDLFLDYRDEVFIRYSLFDLTKIYVYSLVDFVRIF